MSIGSITLPQRQRYFKIIKSYRDSKLSDEQSSADKTLSISIISLTVEKKNNYYTKYTKWTEDEVI